MKRERLELENASPFSNKDNWCTFSSRTINRKTGVKHTEGRATPTGTSVGIVPLVSFSQFLWLQSGENGKNLSDCVDLITQTKRKIGEKRWRNEENIMCSDVLIFKFVSEFCALFISRVVNQVHLLVKQK